MALATTYTYAENAAFLHSLASTLERDGGQAADVVERLHDLAAREAEHDPAYVAYVNAKVKAALAHPGPYLDDAEVGRLIESW